MQDGNSGVGDFDLNHLRLYVAAPSAFNSTTGLLTGGVDTGIILNGFRGGGLQDTQTFHLDINSGTTGAAILAILNGNAGRISAFVVSDNPNDTFAAPNEVFVGNDAFNAQTTLTLSNVPEPGMLTMLGAAGLLLVLAPQVRRWRSRC
jgi:hypothetical protein